jgi:hypothetical protein
MIDSAAITLTSRQHTLNQSLWRFRFSEKVFFAKRTQQVTENKTGAMPKPVKTGLC